MSKKIEMICNTCSKKVMKWKSQVKGKFYCCKKCYHESLKGHIPHNKGVFNVCKKKCLNCDQIITGEKSKVEKRKFCSIDCFSKYKEKNGIMINHKYTKLYLVWRTMINRCHNNKNKSFHRYGGRGVFVCSEWYDDYQAFRSWANKNGYTEGLSLDRINNDGNYEPNNCRFATAKEQANNTSKTVYTEIDGEMLTLNQISEKYNLEYSLVKSRYFRGKRGEDIIKQVGYFNKPLFSKDYLTEKYLNEKKSMLEIASENNVNSVTVLKYLKRYNIQRRSLSETTKLSWKKRRE